MPLGRAPGGHKHNTGRTNDAVGRRVMATFLDEEGDVQWYPAVIVEYRPNARIYHLRSTV